MGIDIVVVRNLFKPLPAGATSYGLSVVTARRLGRQPESTLSHGIDEIGDSVFNRTQVERLCQEFRFLARETDAVTTHDLQEAAFFIEREMAAIGSGADRYVVFLGD